MWVRTTGGDVIEVEDRDGAQMVYDGRAVVAKKPKKPKGDDE